MPLLSITYKRRLVTALQLIVKHKLVSKFTNDEKMVHNECVEKDTALTPHVMGTELTANEYDKKQTSLFSCVLAAENLVKKYHTV
jgi:hypothetical protein